MDYQIFNKVRSYLGFGALIFEAARQEGIVASAGAGPGGLFFAMWADVSFEGTLEMPSAFTAVTT